MSGDVRRRPRTPECERTAEALKVVIAALLGELGDEAAELAHIGVAALVEASVAANPDAPIPYRVIRTEEGHG